MRPLGAWLTACALATVVASAYQWAVEDAVILNSPVSLPLYTYASSTIGIGLPFSFAINFIREQGWERPISDIAFCVLIAIAGPSLMAYLGYGFVVDHTMTQVQWWAQLTIPAAIVGFVAGGTYWMLAERPSPPYVDG